MVSNKSGTQIKAYVENDVVNVAADPLVSFMNAEQLQKQIQRVKRDMEKAARELDFMEAARLRDEMFELEKLVKQRS